jgi:hypothetical protein
VRVLTVAPDRVDQGDALCVAPRAVEHVVEPAVEVAAGAEDDVRLRDRDRVAGARLVVVRVGVGAQDRVDGRSLPRDVAREVGDLGGRRDGLDGRIVAAPAAAADEREQQSADDAGRGRAHGRPTITN